MIIKDRNVNNSVLFNTTIYLLTGDVETTKFFSNLTSACSQLGYFIEDVVKSKITLPIVNQSELGLRKGKYVLFKPKFNKQVPDFVLVDDVNKTINIFEMKINLRNADSKKVFGEKTKYESLKNYLDNIYKNYNVILYAVDFFNMDSQRRNIKLYEQSGVLGVITGQEFCDMISVNYDEVMSEVYKHRQENQNFILEYKSKLLDELNNINFKKDKNLLSFL
jgi:hypothetical protein